MLELLFATMQWSLITGIWVFTFAGFYHSYKEIRRVYRRANTQTPASKVAVAPVRDEPTEWLVAA